MEIKSNSVKELIQLYKTNLAVHYPAHEIMQIIYLLFEEYMGWSKTKVHLSYIEDMPENKMFIFDQFLSELITGKPVQYVLGWTLFNGIKIIVNNNVLIPRPETEELCLKIKSDLSLKTKMCFSILDIGTGSGCISIDLKKNFPTSIVTGIDCSQPAIDIASTNANANNCSVNFLLLDILNPVDCSTLGLFDLIVSNPPYVRESEKATMHMNVKAFEPASALFVPDEDPLKYYEAIAAFALEHLTHEGRLYFEINEKFGRDVCLLTKSLGFGTVDRICDINGKDRFIRAILRIP
jgi:release factor glutamine methyltransferase